MGNETKRQWNGLKQKMELNEWKWIEFWNGMELNFEYKWSPME